MTSVLEVVPSLRGEDGPLVVPVAPLSASLSTRPATSDGRTAPPPSEQGDRTNLVLQLWPPPPPSASLQTVIALLRIALAAFVSVTVSSLRFWRDAAIFVSCNRMKPSSLRALSIVLLAAHYLLSAALESKVGGAVRELLMRPFVARSVGGRAMDDSAEGGLNRGTAPHAEAEEEVSPLILSLFVGVAVVSTMALILSTHMWLNLLSRIASDPDGPPGMAVAGIVALLVTQSVFPCVLVLNGAYACWTGDLLWLCGGVLTSIMWAMPTVGLFGAVRERYLAPERGL